MLEYCSLFAGVIENYEALQELFEEWEDSLSDDDDDIDHPTCKAGELLGFGWYDHDWIDYVITDQVLGLKSFFSHDIAQRADKWEIEDLNSVYAVCEKHGISQLNFLYHLGEENFGSLAAGARAEIIGSGFIQFLGYFWPNGRHVAQVADS